MAFQRGRTWAQPEGPGEQAVAAGCVEGSGQAGQHPAVAAGAPEPDTGAFGMSSQTDGGSFLLAGRGVQAVNELWGVSRDSVLFCTQKPS